MSRKLPFFFILALSLTGCSKFLDKFSRLAPGQSLVQFSDGRRNLTGPLLSGGILVYATRSDGVTQTIKLDDQNDDSPHALPNGVWTFKAVGYPENASPPLDNMEENPRCGESTGSFTLSGTGTQLVNLELDVDNCTTGDFSDASFVNTDLKPIEFTFCDHASDASSFTGTSDPCGQGRSSPSFKNSAPSGNEARRIQYDSGSERFTYMADTYGFMELFSSDSNGKNVIRQNAHFVNTSTRAVSDFELIYNEDTMTSTGKAVYLSDDEYADAGKSQLYLTTIGQQGSVRISPTLAGGLTTGIGVQSFKVSKDGRYVVFVERTLESGPYDLYAVDLQSASPGPTSAKKLSHDVNFGSGLQPPAAGAEWDFKILPDSEHVVFAGIFENATMGELFIVPIADKIADETDDTLIDKISHASNTHSSYLVKELRMSHDGSILFWKGNPCTSCPSTHKRMLYGTDLSDPAVPGTPVLVSVDAAGPDEPNANLPNGYWTSSTHDLLAFVGDIETPGMNELWVIDFSAFPTLTSSKIDNDGSLGYSYVQFTPGGTGIVFLKGNGTMSFPNDKQIFASPVTGGGIEFLTPLMTQGFDLTGGGGDNGGPFKIVDENRVFYIGDVSGGLPTLRMSSLDTDFTEVSLIGTTANPSAISKKFDVGYDHVFFTMDGDTATEFQAYKIPIGTDPDSDPATYPDPEALTAVASMVNTEDVHVPRPEFQSLMGTSGAVFLGSRRGSSSPQDTYFVSNFAVAGSDTPIKLSHVDAGTDGSGRYRVTLMGYDSAGNETAGISSQCFKANGSDGMKTSHGIKIPYGNAGAGIPFRVKVEIFPNSESCTGSSRQVQLTDGLANYSVGNSEMKLVTGGTETALFLSY